MTNRHESEPSGNQLPETEFKIYDCLNRRRDFMKAVEVTVDTDISPAKVIKGLDYLYDRRLVMARLVLDGQAIVVTVDEAMNSDAGFSLTLDKLLVGVGVDSTNWTRVEKDWAVLKEDGGFPDYIPDGIIPNEVFSLAN